MEQELIRIVAFVFYALTMILGTAAIILARDRNMLRCLALAAGIALTYFNNEISHYIYLTIGASLEAIFYLYGITFLIIGGLILVLMPVFFVIHWLTR